MGTLSNVTCPECQGNLWEIRDGDVIIAAITSCTNTSNPSVMIGAGLLAKKAVERGLETQAWVKSSLAPGSRVVTDYLEGSGLLPYLDRLRFNVVGYGCTTCIGNSGPLPDVIAGLIDEHSLVTAAVLSGNRNFEARVHPQVRANYLASPMLVVAFALVGRVDVDLTREPLGTGRDGKPVYLRDIWPSAEEIQAAMSASLKPELFERRYASVFEGDDTWQSLQVPEGSRYAWDPSSTYVQEPPFFADLPPQPPPLRDITAARALAVLGDKRWPGKPDVPTLKEQGLGKMGGDAWYGILAAKGTPQPAIDRLSNAIGEAAKDPALNEKLVASGNYASFQDAATFAGTIEADRKSFGEIIKTASIKL